RLLAPHRLPGPGARPAEPSAPRRSTAAVCPAAAGGASAPEWRRRSFEPCSSDPELISNDEAAYCNIASREQPAAFAEFGTAWRAAFKAPWWRYLYALRWNSCSCGIPVGRRG